MFFIESEPISCKNSYCKPVAVSEFESLEATIEKQNEYYKDTLYIRAHLEAAQHEYFAKEDSKKRKVSFKTVERYLTSVAEQCCFRMYECLPNISNRSNSHGANLPPNKKIKVTGQNLHELWKKHKPVLNV